MMVLKKKTTCLGEIVDSWISEIDEQHWDDMRKTLVENPVKFLIKPYPRETIMTEQKKEPCQRVLFFKIRLWSEANIDDHWSKKRNRRLFQQNYIAQRWYTEGLDIKPPVRVTLTRLAPRTLDDDNLVTAFKGIRDRVASLLVPGLRPGRADNDPGIEWHYSQEKNKQYIVKITLSPIEEKTA